MLTAQRTGRCDEWKMDRSRSFLPRKKLANLLGLATGERRLSVASPEAHEIGTVSRAVPQDGDSVSRQRARAPNRCTRIFYGTTSSECIAPEMEPKLCGRSRGRIQKMISACARWNCRKAERAGAYSRNPIRIRPRAHSDALKRAAPRIANGRGIMVLYAFVLCAHDSRVDWPRLSAIFKRNSGECRTLDGPALARNGNSHSSPGVVRANGIGRIALLCST